MARNGHFQSISRHIIVIEGYFHNVITGIEHILCLSGEGLGGNWYPRNKKHSEKRSTTICSFSIMENILKSLLKICSVKTVTKIHRGPGTISC